MIANGERKFLPLSLFSNYRRTYFIHFKKSRFVEVVLFYPKNEVIGFPKIEINEFVSAMFMFK